MGKFTAKTSLCNHMEWWTRMAMRLLMRIWGEHALINGVNAPTPLSHGEEHYKVKRGSQFVNEYARKTDDRLRTDGGPSNPNHLWGAFPVLFPYGIGGFETTRRSPVPYEVHACWALQYGDIDPERPPCVLSSPWQNGVPSIIVSPKVLAPHLQVDADEYFRVLKCLTKGMRFYNNKGHKMLTISLSLSLPPIYWLTQHMHGGPTWNNLRSLFRVQTMDSG